MIKKISDYLKNNDINNDVNDIIVDYRLSTIIRQIALFYPDKEYQDNDRLVKKECYMGDVVINERKYRLVCDLSLEEGDIYFK